MGEMDIRTLRRSVRGTVIERFDPDCDGSRRALLFNGCKPQRRSKLIVRAACIEDVRAVVRFADAEGMRVSVRGGGHHWSGIALQEGIVLDLSALNRVTVGAEARVAEIEPTVTNRDLARILAAHGLAFPLELAAD
jgi:FAD/FMN-containing dehydrogenase